MICLEPELLLLYFLNIKTKGIAFLFISKIQQIQERTSSFRTNSCLLLEENGILLSTRSRFYKVKVQGKEQGQGQGRGLRQGQY